MPHIVDLHVWDEHSGPNERKGRLYVLTRLFPLNGARETVLMVLAAFWSGVASGFVSGLYLSAVVCWLRRCRPGLGLGSPAEYSEIPSLVNPGAPWQATAFTGFGR